MQVLTVVSLALTIVLELWIVALLIKRRLQERFVWFFAYIVYAIFECTLRLAVLHNPIAYSKVYWSTEIGDVALTVIALRESFLSIFWHETRLRWFRAVFWSCVGLAIIYAGLKAWVSPPKYSILLSVLVWDMEFALNTVVSIVGLLYGSAIRLFGIMDHQRETGIILGFALNASLSVFSVITRSAFGTRFVWLSAWVPAIAYIVAEVVWIRELMRPEQMLPEPKETLEQMSEAIEKYIAFVHKYLRMER
jgi:hypothetical protein